MVALLEAGMSCARIDLTVKYTGLPLNGLLLHSACCFYTQWELAAVPAHTQKSLQGMSCGMVPSG